MTKGDDSFNVRDFDTVEEVHHPYMIEFIPGNAEPVYGKGAHGVAMQQFLRIFPDIHVYSDPYPIQFGSGDWITVVTHATGTFTGEMTLPDGTVIPPTGKAFDVEFGQTTKWDGDQLIVISAFYDAAVQGADRPRLAAKEAGRPPRAKPLVKASPRPARGRGTPRPARKAAPSWVRRIPGRRRTGAGREPG